MAAFVLCSVCHRHVRPEETECPFCGALGTALKEPLRWALPRDAKRATIFALGLTLMGQACGGKSEESNDGHAGTGSTSTPGGSAIPSPGPNRAVGGPTRSPGDPGEGISNAVPPYGTSVLPIRPPPDTGGNGESVNEPDAGTDADVSDAGADRDAAPPDAGGSDPIAGDGGS